MHPKWQEKIGLLPLINQTLEQLPRPNRTIGHFGCFSAGLWLLRVRPLGVDNLPLWVLFRALSR